jgi:hypothetical protein
MDNLEVSAPLAVPFDLLLRLQAGAQLARGLCLVIVV